MKTLLFTTCISTFLLASLPTSGMAACDLATAKTEKQLRQNQRVAFTKTGESNNFVIEMQRKNVRESVELKYPPEFKRFEHTLPQQGTADFGTGIYAYSRSLWGRGKAHYVIVTDLNSLNFFDPANGKFIGSLVFDRDINRFSNDAIPEDVVISNSGRYVVATITRPGERSTERKEILSIDLGAQFSNLELIKQRTANIIAGRPVPTEGDLSFIKYHLADGLEVATIDERGAAPQILIIEGGNEVKKMALSSMRIQ